MRERKREREVFFLPHSHSFFCFLLAAFVLVHFILPRFFPFPFILR